MNAVLDPFGRSLPDPKADPRIEDRALLRALHVRWTHCALCFAGYDLDPELRTIRLSLHHVLNHPRDDVEANLIMLCGHGTAGHHGLVQHYDGDACRALARYITVSRPDTFQHLSWRLGSAIAADEWLRRLRSHT